MESTKEEEAANQDIAKLNNAITLEKWEKVNTLLSKKHCIEFFNKNPLIKEGNFASVYIDSVVNKYATLSKAMERYFSMQENISNIIVLSLKSEKSEIFFNNITKDALEAITSSFNFSWKFIMTQNLKDNLYGLQHLSQCQTFPAVQFQ